VAGSGFDVTRRDVRRRPRFPALRQSMNILAIAALLFFATPRSCIECSRSESSQTARSMELFRSSRI